MTHPHRLPLPALAGLAALTLVVAGCTAGDTSPATKPSASGNVPVRAGGAIVIGAEQEPDCTDWIATCGGSIWGTYMMQTPTIPKVFDVRRQGDNWVPVRSELMAAEPTIKNGDRPEITYRLNPDAVWSDGKPITSQDLKYTALQIRDGKDIFDKTGYDRIASIETPDDRTTVVTLKSSYGGWRTLFSSGYGVLPAHLLEGRNRNAVMKDGYDFSGGPWKIKEWKKGTSVTLIPNDRFWGRKPKLDQVTFQFTPDTAAAFQAFKSGQLDALYPTPQLDVVEQIKSGLSGAHSQVDAQTGNLEALWTNNEAFPFDSRPVREAVARAVDRKAIIERLYGALGVKEPAQSFLSPLLSSYATSAFSTYTRDLAKVEQLMTGAGWARNGEGVWAKDGRPARFTIVSLAGNKRRELTEQVLQTQLKEAGFQLDIKNTTPANLFGKQAPAGDFQMGLWTLVDTFPDPSLSNSFSSTRIPTEANGHSGINFIRANVEGLDELLETVDTELDITVRKEASVKADELIAGAVPSIPLGAVPNVLLWSQRLGGPLSINPAEGPWWNLEEWGLAQ
ncbi:peptide ABC transporter substrate-binding protein [Nonomuraea lactucae]|uniref:peptide ABC transporter substrate-binding protein n=1 Tax=Nonomuraea lactucae TaxID=2249762 RepID=UPI000DE2FB7C|nr:peptide ABC transporter substrate-binding protein [Nonomuraea lactucae]